MVNVFEFSDFYRFAPDMERFTTFIESISAFDRITYQSDVNFTIMRAEIKGNPINI